ncbi:hypothetical protein GETHLI_35130 [Geothrix limicola]|uniref:histidine kinase n=1 Tax=Geothrix limicola TaxID=2927978 RepID=A0ABQ5QJF3_9BACT|nr:ATP-binding protein [Geothrix limicola]GLH75010.1 hypothetical protein GETHLI_35130 [Geothrix limicola]
MASRMRQTARVLLVGAWMLVAGLHLALRPEQRRLTWPLGYLLLEALAAASLAYRAWRTPGESRTAWWLLAASAFLEVPNLIFNSLELQGLLPAWAEHLQSYLALGTGLLVLAGVLSFPMGHDRGLRFRRRALDSLIFAASLLFLLWVMGIQGSLHAAAHGIGLRVFAAYLNAALFGGGLVFMTSYHPDCIRGPLGWLAASSLAWLAALSGWTLSGLPPVVAIHGWIIVAAAIPLFQGLAAWSPKSVEEIVVEVDFDRSSGLFSYLPVLLAVLVLAALLAWAPRQVTRETYALFLAVVVLLLLRQFQAILDLRAARSTLEARVQHRTKALEQAQDTLIRTERMNTLALMGAGLAHDLNNLLCAVKSSADLALLNLEEGLPPGVEDLTRISGAADRAALLTRRLMEFARREVEALAPVELGREIHGMEETLRLLLPRSVDLRIQVGAEAMVVWSTRLRLEQMLVNLVANAGDAMPKGGTLHVKVARSGDQALIEVADSGVGMGPEVLARIFDPFFTTKAPGKGTGLGLSSLKAMVEEGNGRLEVESEPGKGSRFRLLMPLMRSEALSPR